MKNKTKARTPHNPLPEAVTREIISALAVICAQNKKNIAIASAATSVQINDKNLQTFAPVLTCSQNL